eukprot:6179888-Pleurochrysis_carterae.AAC.1
MTHVTLLMFTPIPKATVATSTRVSPLSNLHPKRDTQNARIGPCFHKIALACASVRTASRRRLRARRFSTNIMTADIEPGRGQLLCFALVKASIDQTARQEESHVPCLQ